MQIKTLHDRHRCPRVEKVSTANSKWIAEKYRVKISSDPKWAVSSMVTVIQHDQKLQFSRFQMYRAKEKVKAWSLGSIFQEYCLLYSYIAEIVRSIPDTTVKLKTKVENGEDVFKRLYICWGPLKKGFLSGCRPAIYLDGCHLKTECGGILLVAVGIDPNNCLYHFAYAIVEKEKSSTWQWFLGLIMKDLGIRSDHSDWVIMSDKQNGIIDAVDSLLPNAEHRFCVMHLYNNFKVSHKGLALKQIVWRAAKATRISEFAAIIRDLRDKDLEAFKWLAKRPAAHWSRAYFRCFSTCDLLLNNFCESFNSLIIKARSMAIIDMLESIRMTLMKRTYVKRDEMRASNLHICPNIDKILEENNKKSMDYIAHWNGHDQFDIIGCWGDKFKVHLGEKTCGCRAWQLSGIPCCHAISAIWFMHKQAEDYVDECYHKDTFMRVYSNLMVSLNGHDEWSMVLKKLHPPVKEKFLVGQSRKKRRKTPDEFAQENAKKNKKVPTGAGDHVGQLGKQGLTMKCRICGTAGHNKRGCKQNPKNHHIPDRVEVPPGPSR